MKFAARPGTTSRRSDPETTRRRVGRASDPLLTSNELLRPDGSSGPAIDTLEHFEDLRRAIDEPAAEMPRAADVVRLRFLVGFSVQETPDLLGVSLRTAESDWTFAKAFLAARLDSV